MLINEENLQNAGKAVHSSRVSRELHGTLTFSADGHQLHPLAADEVQSFVHVGDLVETHLALVGFGQPLA